jgi:hypothetical protein
MSGLSIKTQQALDALRSAVAEALERKRRLGRYAVIWKDGQVVRLDPGDGEHPRRNESKAREKRRSERTTQSRVDPSFTRSSSRSFASGSG